MVTIAVALWLTGMTAADTLIPKGAAATVNGVIGDAEWDDAASIVVGGATVWLKHDGTDLFVAVRGLAPIIANVCVERGDTVDVLHGSGSVGFARFGPGPNRARLADFVWALRDGSPEARSDSARDAYYAEHGWVGTTVGLEPKEREFRVGLRRLGSPPRLTVAVLNLLSASVLSWPGVEGDGCADQAMLMGRASASTFHPENWAPLRISPAGVRP